jgi:hypothetical protein
MNLQRFLELVVFVATAVLNLHAANYCVDASAGSDTNSGTCSPYHPWKTISRVNTGPTGKYQPGDVVSFMGAQTFPGEVNLSSTNIGGTDAQRAANPITVNSFGTGRATISSGATANGLYIFNVAGVHVTNINFVGSSFGASGGYQSGIAFSSDLATKLTYAYVDHVTIRGYRWDGIYVIGNNVGSGYNNVSIDSVVIYNCGHDGIDIAGQSTPPAYSMSNVYVGHSHIYNIAGIPGETAGSGQPVNLFNGVNGGTVEYTTTHDSGQQNSPQYFGPVGISATGSTYITFQFNEVYNQHTGPTSLADGDGFDLDAGVTNSVMQYNYSHNNDGAGFLLCGGGAAPNSNNAVRYNISENDGRNNFGGANKYGGITVIGDCGGGSQGLGPEQIYNNTVYMSGTGSSPAVRVFPQDGAVNDVQFNNNILITSNALPQVELTSTTPVSGLSFISNLYYDSGWGYKVLWNGTTYSGIQQWAAGTGQEQLPAGTYQYTAADPGVCNAGRGGTRYPNPLSSLTAYKLIVGSAPSNSSVAIDYGADLRSLFGIDPGSRDFYGPANDLPTIVFSSQWGGFDLGADEAQPGQVCP